MKEKNRVVIDVERWGQSALLNDDGSMCCLGFISEQALCVKPEHMLSRPYYPSELMNNVPEWYEERHLRAARINDSTELSRGEKMAKLKELFADSPIELVFTEGGKELP